MKFLVTAKITDSPIVPVSSFTAEKEFEFSDNSDVFGRVYVCREYFKGTYKTNNIEIIKAQQL